MDSDKAHERQRHRQVKKDRKQPPPERTENEDGGGKGPKLRGLPRDTPEARLSKTLSWLLRHGAASEGLKMRSDGYVLVNDILALARLQELTFEHLRAIVKDDAKNRYNLTLEVDPKTGEEVWWIRANQGHSMKSVVLDLQPITSQTDIPTGIAVHGTNKRAWENIKTRGLSKMKRNHIHFAQGIPGTGVISGMRTSSEILIFVDVQKALDAGIQFHLSTNGVVLTAGDGHGLLSPEFFSRVENVQRQPLPGWDGPEGVTQVASSCTSAEISAEIGTDHGDEHRRAKSVSVGPDKRDEAIQVSSIGSAETSLQPELERKVEATTLSVE